MLSNNRPYTVKTKTLFWGMLNLFHAYVKPKRGWCVFRLVFKMSIRSATSFKRSQRELSNDVAEHRCMLKNYQNQHYPF